MFNSTLHFLPFLVFNSGRFFITQLHSISITSVPFQFQIISISFHYPFILSLSHNNNRQIPSLLCINLFSTPNTHHSLLPSSQSSLFATLPLLTIIISLLSSSSSSYLLLLHTPILPLLLLLVLLQAYLRINTTFLISGSTTTPPNLTHPFSRGPQHALPNIPISRR